MLRRTDLSRTPLSLDDSDLNCVLSLANAYYEIHPDEAIRELVEAMIRARYRRVNPTLLGGELEEAVSEDLRERVELSRSNTATFELIALAKDVDADIEHSMFGDCPDDLANAILVSDRALKSVAEQAYQGYLDNLSIYPERGLVHPRDFIDRYPPSEEESEQYEWIVGDFVCMIRDRRNDVIVSLIADCKEES